MPPARPCMASGVGVHNGGAASLYFMKSMSYSVCSLLALCDLIRRFGSPGAHFPLSHPLKGSFGRTMIEPDRVICYDTADPAAEEEPG